MFKLYDPNISEKITELTEAVSKLNMRDSYDYWNLFLPSIISLSSVFLAYLFCRQEFNKNKKYEREHQKRKVYIESNYKLFKISRNIIDISSFLIRYRKEKNKIEKNDVIFGLFNETDTLLFDILIDYDVNGYHVEKNDTQSLLLEFSKLSGMLSKADDNEKIIETETIEESVIDKLFKLSERVKENIDKWNTEY